MEVTGDKEVIYEFGRFMLDPPGKTLYLDGQPIHLPAKEFDTLLMLVQNNGRALSKDDLLAAIWGETFVEEGNLAKQISRLRKILNTDGAEFIETIPKHGYRFYAEVRVRRPESATIERQIVNRVTIVQDVSDETPKLLPAQGAHGTARYLVAGLAILAVGAVSYLLLNRTYERAAPSAIRSVAVLPFANLGTADEEGLRLGIMDAVTTKLSELEPIVVRPTSAVRPFDGQDAVAAGRTLGVDAVLAGSVQRTADQIRVTVQLIDIGDGHVMWGDTFNEQLKDLLRVQDTIASQVARSLELKLSGQDLQQMAKRHTANADAHYAYVKGRIAWNKRTANDIKQSVADFEEAIRLDPNYALAYAGLADAYSLMADYRAAPTLESYERARVAAQRALELDPDLAEAHTALAYVSMYGLWDLMGAEAGYSRAVELNRNYATAHQWFSEYLASQGRTEEALAEIRRAKEIDPLSPVINAGEVWVLYFGRRYDEAIDLGRKLAEMRPDFAEVQEYLKRCYDQKGMYREAIKARQMRRKLVGLDHEETPALRRAASAADHQTYWKARLEQELTEMRTEDPSSFDMVEIYAQLGDRDKAFDWLERAATERTYSMIYLNVAPNLDSLRSDPRFAEFLRRVGL